VTRVSSLESLENEFQSFLLTRAVGIEQRVVGSARVPIATRLAIYGNAYRARLAETLEAHYPALLSLLGAEEFNNLCSAYIDAHDSHFASIRFYGADLAALLTDHAHYKSTPLLGELARFEWAMTEVFDAADATPLNVQALATIAPTEWAGLAFDVHPSLRRLDLNCNAPELWKALTADRAPPQAACEEPAVAWLLWRRELQIYFRPLAGPEAAALDAVRGGQSFGELCVTLCAACSEAAAPARAAGYLREWVESGMIIGTHACEE
jgi:hypothetical protein